MTKRKGKRTRPAIRKPVAADEKAVILETPARVRLRQEVGDQALRAIEARILTRGT